MRTLEASLAHIHAKDQSMSCRCADRTLAKYVGVETDQRLGITKARQQTDKCLTDQVWDNVVSKRIAKDVREITQELHVAWTIGAQDVQWYLVGGPFRRYALDSWGSGFAVVSCC